MISVFTPSHNPQFLDEAYDSLKAQTYEDWEWVVLLNGGVEWTPPEDFRVRVFTSESRGIGRLKAEAVTYCEGEFLVELDHDDLLTSNALMEIRNAFRPDVGLVYSNWAHIDEFGEPINSEPWPLSVGWLYYTDQVDGREMTVFQALPATPSNLARIWYTPNHVRAFSREAYDSVGGYRPLPFLDDQDLVSRLFCFGPFVHVEECLYLQRQHPSQSQVQSAVNALIQTETVAMGDEWLPHLAAAWRGRREG